MRLPGRRPGPRPAGVRPGIRPTTRRPRGPAAHPIRHAATPAGASTVGPAVAGPSIRPRLRLPRPTRLPRFTPARAGAILGLLAALGGIYGLAATPAFTYARAEIPELRWTSRSAVEAAIGIAPGTNLFRLTVEPLEERIRRLPGIAAAHVAIALPDRLVVSVDERAAILAWAVGESRFLVDREGVLFAATDPTAVAGAGLPVVVDARPEAATLAVGGRLDPVDLDAATRLGSLVPADVGSVADALVVTVDAASGFVIGTDPGSWVAIFGLYTPSQRPPSIVPGQVRLLRSLLDGREATIARVILATEEAGTYTLRPTPDPSGPVPSPSP